MIRSTALRFLCSIPYSLVRRCNPLSLTITIPSFIRVLGWMLDDLKLEVQPGAEQGLEWPA